VKAFAGLGGAGKLRIAVSYDTETTQLGLHVNGGVGEGVALGVDAGLKIEESDKEARTALSLDLGGSATASGSFLVGVEGEARVDVVSLSTDKGVEGASGEINTSARLGLGGGATVTADAQVNATVSLSGIVDGFLEGVEEICWCKVADR